MLFILHVYVKMNLLANESWLFPSLLRHLLFQSHPVVISASSGIPFIPQDLQLKITGIPLNKRNTGIFIPVLYAAGQSIVIPLDTLDVLQL